MSTNQTCTNLISDFNLSGHSFEFIAKVLLRRMRENNFIFQLSQYRDITEIVTKYKLDVSNANWLLSQKIRADLIEFIFDNLQTRIVTQVKLYEVKVVRVQDLRPDMTFSTNEFYRRILDNNLATVDFVIIRPGQNWNFEWFLIPYLDVRVHTHKSISKKSFYPRIYAQRPSHDTDDVCSLNLGNLSRTG